MKLLPKSAPRPRQLRRFILTATILPAVLATSAFGVDWNGAVALNTGDPGLDNVRVLGNSTVTLTNTGDLSITENLISFEPTLATELLTVNGPGLELRSLSTVLAIVSGTASIPRVTTISGTADFAPGALYTGPAVGSSTLTNVHLIKDGAGTMILDDPLNALAGATLKVVNGTLSILGGGGTVNPVSTLTTPIDLGNSNAASTTAVLRIGSNVGDTTFANLIKATRNSTIEHISATTDTIAGIGNTPTIGINSNRTLTFNVTAGGLVINGSVSDPASDLARGGTLRKTGAGTTLRLTGTTFVSNLNVVDGRVEIPAGGRLRIFNDNTTTALVLGPTGTLSVLNTSVSQPNNLPTTILIPTGGTLEGLPGSFVTAAAAPSALSLTGGSLNLGVGGPVPGLTAHLYTGNDTGANLAFGGPDFPANTITNYLNYFAGRGPGLVTSTGANGFADLNFGGGDTMMYAPIAPTFTATNNIVSRFNGKIVITTGGLYNFGATSDDGSMVYIDNAAVVSNNRYQGAFRRSGTVCLAPGVHDIEIGFYEGGGDNILRVDYSGPDTANVQTNVPNSVLIPGDSLAFLNPITVTASSVINTSAASVPSTTFPTTAKTLNVNGYALDLGVLTLAGGAGLYTINASTQNAEITARSITDSGAAVSLVNNGPGMLVLESGAAAQLVNGVAVTSGALGVVLGGAGGSPTGNATVNVNGGSLTLSSKGGNQTYTPVGLSFTNGGSIAAAQIGTGVAGTAGTPIRITLTPALTVSNGNTLALTSYDQYILRVAGVSGGGTVNIVCGTVESSGAVNLTGTGQLTVAYSNVSTLAGAAAGAITVSDSTLTNTGTLASANALSVTKSTLTSSGAISATGAMTVTSSTVTANAGATAASLAITGSTFINTGALATGASGIALNGGALVPSTLELRGGSISGGAIAAQGAIIHATSGLTVSTVSANFTGLNSTGLNARHALTGGGGIIFPGNTQAGILAIETRPGADAILTTALSFGPQGGADGVISTFFGGADTTSGFTMGFFGNFTPQVPGLYSFQTGIVDDTAGIWVDLDGDGVFETAGGAGNELIAQGGCCADGPVGTVNLVAGHTYRVAIGVEDGQGGSSLEGRFGLPGAGLSPINPTDPAQAGLWTYGVPNQVIVDAGAELDIQAINGSVNVLVNGRLQFDGAGSSTFDSLVIGPGGIVEVGSGPPSPAGLEGAALAVPEPGSLGLAFLGALGLLGRRPRVRRG